MAKSTKLYILTLGKTGFLYNANYAKTRCEFYYFWLLNEVFRIDKITNNRPDQTSDIKDPWRVTSAGTNANRQRINRTQTAGRICLERCVSLLGVENIWVALYAQVYNILHHSMSLVIKVNFNPY